MNPKERNFVQEVLSANQSILGTSLFVVIYVGIVLGVHSSLPMSRIGSDGSPVGEEGNLCLFIPIMLVGENFGAVSFLCMGKLKGSLVGNLPWSYKIGRKYMVTVFWPTALMTVIFVMGPVMVLAYLPDITVVTFYNLELPMMLVYMIVRGTMLVKPTNDFLLKEGAIDNAKAEALTRRNSVRRASQAALKFVHEPTATTQNKRQSGIKTLFATMTNLLIFLAYPFTVLTLFRSFGVGGRMAIVLLFHPLIMEFLMHGYRASTGVTTIGLGDEVKIDPMRDLMGVFIMESYLVLIRRIMLCNLGSFQATTIAIIVTGVEETAVRSTIEVNERAKWARATTHLILPPPNTPHPPHIIHSNETFGTAIFTSTSPQSPPKRWPT